MKAHYFLASLVVSSLATTTLAAAADSSSQPLQVTSTLKIPGATLQPGKYTVSVEDHLKDRAIVRVSGTDSEHYLLLAVPSKRLSPIRKGSFSYFQAADNTQALRGWKCSGCATPLEFVYSKADAVALTGTSAKPVLAVDPTYDKLPANLSADDMKVVTLWLVSPETITADNKGQGVKAAKLADAQPTEVAAAQSSPKTSADTTEVADARPPAGHRLPHTGTNTFSLLAAGLLLFMGAGALRVRNNAARSNASNL